MNGPEDPIAELSPAARQRMHAMLPGLLSTVRWRRRRRVLGRAGLAAGVLLFAVWLWPSGGDRVSPGPGAGPGPTRTGPVCEIVRTDPAEVAGWRVATAVPADWYLDDDGLSRFLRESARPAGLVRVRGRVLVATEAVDPFPSGP